MTFVDEINIEFLIDENGKEVKDENLIQETTDIIEIKFLEGSL